METLSKSYPLAMAAPAHHELLVVVDAVIGSCDSSRGLPAARFAEEELEVSDAKRLKALEDENRRLKRLLADSLLDNAALNDLLGKNV